MLMSESFRFSVDELFFFFSSRRRHTRCALVTGVQTCALPIFLASVRKTGKAMVVYEDNRTYGAGAEIAATIAEEAMFDLDGPIVRIAGPDVPAMRSEERRVGKECVSTCRSRWSPYH